MLNEASSASGVSSVVSSTIGSEMPSIPRWYEALMAAYQAACSTNWKGAAGFGSGLKRAQATRVKAKGMMEAASAPQRKALTYLPGTNSKMSAATVGANKINVSRGFSIKSIRLVPPPLNSTQL